MKGLTFSPLGNISVGSIQKPYNKPKPSLTPAGAALLKENGHCALCVTMCPGTYRQKGWEKWSCSVEIATYRSVNFPQEQQCLVGDVFPEEEIGSLSGKPKPYRLLSISHSLAIHSTSVNKWYDLGDAVLVLCPRPPGEVKLLGRMVPSVLTVLKSCSAVLHLWAVYKQVADFFEL